ncbi:MAG TPA: hypothetical protein GXX30_10015 [Firmicutes bacterium]|nr:hypothetical protein [Candidatus Fermentithermobacillaceae bacterium]
MLERIERIARATLCPASGSELSIENAVSTADTPDRRICAEGVEMIPYCT